LTYYHYFVIIKAQLKLKESEDRQMTNEKRAQHIEIIRKDSNEQLLERFLWYVNNFNPIDEDRCDDYELVKAEVLRRMEEN